MASAVPTQTIDADELLLCSILHRTDFALQINANPNVWAEEITSMLHSSAVTLPSVELARRLVSHFFWNCHGPTAWKILDVAASRNIIPPLLLLALLSTRIVYCRRLQPIAYKHYLELVKLHAFTLETHFNSPKNQMIMESIDDVIKLSQIYGQKDCEPGVVLVEFVFSILSQLLEASLDDERLLYNIPEIKPRWLSNSHDMDIDVPDCNNRMHRRQKEWLLRENTKLAIEIIVEFLQNKMTSRLLSLVHRNMPLHWGSFNYQMQLLASNSSLLRNLKHNSNTLLSLMENIRVGVSHERNTKSKLESNVVVTPTGSQISFAGQSYGSSWSSLWLPIDLILEDALDGGQVAAFSAIEIITGLVKLLHSVSGSKWQNTFLGLWTAALRLVQRERDSKAGPIPRLDTCMCLLLSITTHVVANIVEEEESELIEEAERGPSNQGKSKQVLGKRRGELITSLLLLGNSQCLLIPPQTALMETNQAAAKATKFVSRNPVGSGYVESLTMDDLPTNCSGNLLHLIVEACIARNILDTSAYFWPGYVKPRSNQIPFSISNHVDGWSALMKGSQLTPGLVDVLVATPASSLAEIEKIYEIAISGSDEEKISAATILCGASLVRGWNIQEHSIIFITMLLTPVGLPNHTETESHLINLLSHGSLPIVKDLPGLIPILNLRCTRCTDPDTDEVYAKLRLFPLQPSDVNFDGDTVAGVNDNLMQSYTKTLTQSDANNGGFACPKNCTEIILPPLDYSDRLPSQENWTRGIHLCL
ncbi:unnamed protein product [Vicia faba]|uniref:Mediator of RNA polymerase II transcription subunit 33A n=1 Tax=Vicia faba TaxID=3906 RepID=A0AAV1AZT9_VICFA|nr:unnamed protein product [Vicia faba]